MLEKLVIGAGLVGAAAIELDDELGAIVTAAGVEGVLALVAAVLIALLAVRSQALKLIREDRDAERETRIRLEGELEAAAKRVAELEARPNLDEHAKLLAKIVERIETHDRDASTRATKFLESLERLAAGIEAHASREALVGDTVTAAVDRLTSSVETHQRALELIAGAVSSGGGDKA